MKVVEVDLDDRTYPIYIARGLLDQGELLRKHIPGKTALIITNETIAPLYLDRWACAVGVSALGDVFSGMRTTRVTHIHAGACTPSQPAATSRPRSSSCRMASSTRPWRCCRKFGTRRSSAGGQRHRGGATINTENGLSGCCHKHGVVDCAPPLGWTATPPSLRWVEAWSAT